MGKAERLKNQRTKGSTPKKDADQSDTEIKCVRRGKAIDKRLSLQIQDKNAKPLSGDSIGKNQKNTNEVVGPQMEEVQHEEDEVGKQQEKMVKRGRPHVSANSASRCTRSRSRSRSVSKVIQDHESNNVKQNCNTRVKTSTQSAEQDSQSEEGGGLEPESS